MKKKIITKSFKETQELGRELAEKLIPLKDKAVVFALKGDLGGGKTTFTQGFAKGLGIKEKILSPTFNIMKRFEISKEGFKNFYHFDCYRLDKEGISFFNFKEIMNNPENVIIIEWFENIEESIFSIHTNLSFNLIDENIREIILKNEE